jgi:mono/diheme cytochrome c family protein
MQHNARDPLRDHSHGRIYRITYPERPLVKPFVIYNAEIPVLLENLTSQEYRTRYRIKRELRGRDPKNVIHALNKWINTLEDNKPNTPFLKLEGLWVSWGAGKVQEDLLSELLKDPNYRIRAAATQVLRHNYSIIKNAKNLMLESAKDPHNRVRLEAIIAASWLPKEDGLQILSEASKYALDRWMSVSYRTSFAHLNNTTLSSNEAMETVANLEGKEYEKYIKGKEIYNREGFCGNCHQRDGMGMKGIYPTLSNTEWVTGNPENLIKITLNGLYGPMEINGDNFAGLVPMTAFRNMLNDEEIASVLTYIRNTFGNEEEPVNAGQVSKVRASTADKEGFYTVEELVGKKQNN